MIDEIHLVIREIMREREILIKDLSEMTGIPYISLQRFFAGTHTLPHNRFIYLLEVLDININDVILKNLHGVKFGKREKSSIIKDIAEYLLVIKPYKVKPLIRSILNYAESTKGINGDDVKQLRREFFNS